MKFSNVLNEITIWRQTITMQKKQLLNNIKTTVTNRKNRTGFARLLAACLALMLVSASLPSVFVFADDPVDSEKRQRTVYVHAQGKNPSDTTAVSTVYMGDTADIYVAVDNPNKGRISLADDPSDSTKKIITHDEPQYDMNGFAIKISYDPNYFELVRDVASPIDYEVPTKEFSGDKSLYNDVAYKVYGLESSSDPKDKIPMQGVKTEIISGKKYQSAYVAVFYSNSYLPPKGENQKWYNICKLPLKPLKSGSTNVFVDTSSDDDYSLKLFAKNVSDEPERQYFNYSAEYGGSHQIVIKDKLKPSLPTANPSEGRYTEKQSVELSADDDCDIYYSAGGGRYEKYERPIEIEGTTEIMCYALRASDGRKSDTVKFRYEIVPNAPYLFNAAKQQIPNIYNESSAYFVYAGDSPTIDSEWISEDSEVYYTFAPALDESTVSEGTNPETQWVKVSKKNPTILIDKRRTVKLITDKRGEKSDIAYYYLGVTPKTVESNYQSGDYNRKIDVELTCGTKGAKILYTADGSDPVTEGLEYTGKITLGKDTVIRAAALYDGLYSDVKSFYYRFSLRGDTGVGAFYPSGTYEGSVKVTLTADNPDNKVMFKMNATDEWQQYKNVLVVDKTTKIYAKAVNPTDSSEGEICEFDYVIKPKAPVFSPPTTQFTSNDTISVYCLESNEENKDRFNLYYTTDGSDPITSNSAVMVDNPSDAARVDISGYTVVKAVVLRDGDTYSSVVTQSYDVVSKKPVQPLMTLEPGKYIRKVSPDKDYTTQFVPVPEGTKIYYTISYDGKFMPDPIPGKTGTYEYKNGDEIPVKGNAIIKAVAVNAFNVKSDIGIFGYTVVPEPPRAAPSAEIGGNVLPVVPVYTVKGSTVSYTLNSFKNEFKCADGVFYIDTSTGEAFSDAKRTQKLGSASGQSYSDKAELAIKAKLDGVESDENVYVYKCGASDVLAAPYADKDTGTYEEIKLDNDDTLLKVKFNSLNDGDVIKYRLNNSGNWEEYKGDELLLKKYTVVQLKAEKDGKSSETLSYVYDFVPLAPIITLPSGRYVKSGKPQTEIKFDDRVPSYADSDYRIYFRTCFFKEDKIYSGKRDIDETMSIKAYVKNVKTNTVSQSAVNYYIIEPENSAAGSVYVANPYDVTRLSTDVLDTGMYADGIKLFTQNKNADIHYYYSYTKSDGTQESTNWIKYDNAAPIKVNSSMKDITICARLEDSNGPIGTEVFSHHIDFVKLNVPQTSLGTNQVQFPSGTAYNLINEYADDNKTFLYYTTDGSDPTDENNQNRKLYGGETLTLSDEVTIKAVYMNACGVCINCIDDKFGNCIDKVWSKVGSYTYTVPTRTGGGGTAGGINKGSSNTTDNTRKYTKDIFGTEHPTHIGYVNGYPDGSVRPDGKITREEIAAILYRVYSKRYDKPFSASGELFPDVRANDWAVTEVEYMAQNGVIKGYPDGDFKPANNLTRAEFAALISRYAETKEAEDADVFSDLTNGHWAYKNIMSLYRSGLIQGYEDGTFKPESEVTRAEVVTVINKILGRNPSDSYVKTLEMNPFTDLNAEKWYYTAVLEATVTHDYYLDDKGTEIKWENCK